MSIVDGRKLANECIVVDFAGLIYVYSGACIQHSCCKCINVLYLLISISFHFSMHTD